MFGIINDPTSTYVTNEIYLFRQGIINRKGENMADREWPVNEGILSQPSATVETKTPGPSPSAIAGEQRI